MARLGMTPEDAADLLAARQQWRGDWTPVQRIIQAAQEPLLLECKRLRGLLERSNALLAPLGDPLMTDFGMHLELRRHSLGPDGGMVSSVATRRRPRGGSPRL